MAEKVRIDLDSLTLGELDQIEEVIAPYQLATLDMKALPIKVLIGLIWFTKHKADPTVTLEAVRAVKIDDIDVDFSPTPDPTDAATPET